MGYNVFVEICDAVKQSLPLLVKTRRELHRIPELSGAEIKTQEYICEFLQSRKIPFKKIKTGVVADIAGTTHGQRIAFRADTDALPIKEKTDVPFKSDSGFMHACGHDGHTAVLLALCDLLATEKPPRDVRAVFQFGEEGAGGAEEMIKGGCLDRVTEIYALHVSPDLPEGVLAVSEGAMMAGAVEFTVRFKGKESHCAESEKGIDALKPLAAYLAAQNTFNAPEKNNTMLHTGKIAGGSARNIVAGSAEAYCTLRYFDEAQREAVLGRAAEFLAGTDKSFGTSHSLTVEAVYPPLVNTPYAVSRVRQAAGAGIREAAPRYTAEDFAFYTQKIPGCLTWLGIKSEQYSSPLHSDTFGFREEALLEGLELFLRLI